MVGCLEAEREEGRGCLDNRWSEGLAAECKVTGRNKGWKGLRSHAIGGDVDLHRGQHSQRVLQETCSNFFSIRPWRQFFHCTEVHLLVRKGKKVPFDKDEVSSEISMGVNIVEL